MTPMASSAIIVPASHKFMISTLTPIKLSITCIKHLLSNVDYKILFIEFNTEASFVLPFYGRRRKDVGRCVNIGAENAMGPECD